ncbi:conserved hypothetical protein, membrane [Beggiatoa sp. PS]|nr:conserved hypothetical protein, membrane [Beggiatoa sp. PS]
MSVFKTMLIVPLLSVVMLLYLVFAYGFGVNFDLGSEPFFAMPLPSGAEWAPTWSGIFILFGVVILFFELLKSTKTSTAAQIEHLLSIMVFVVGLMLFLFLEKAGTSTFLIITLMALLDAGAGIFISISSARRDLTMGGMGG